mgnify:CR=1 FL=1
MQMSRIKYGDDWEVGYKNAEKYSEISRQGTIINSRNGERSQWLISVYRKGKKKDVFIPLLSLFISPIPPQFYRAFGIVF